MEGRISGHTGLLALIGSPVGHSGSPAMYNYSFEKLGLDYAYVAFDIKEEQVKEALDAMKLFHMRGCNVTMPDKTEAAKHVDELSPAAQIIGAVNTIVNDDGKLTGYITDGEGFVHNLKDHGIDIKGKKITVAGGGGAATAIQVQCALDGAREITIFNIKDAFFERTLATAEKIRKAVPGIVVNVYDIAVPFASVNEQCRQISVTAIAPTKTFNLAGIQSAAVYAENKALHHKMWRRLNTDEVAEPNAFAMCATIAAFTCGADWLDELRVYIEENKKYVTDFIAREIPQMKVVPSEATYLMWLDCQAYTKDSNKLYAFIRKESGLYLASGREYGTNGDGFLRLNVATTRKNVEDGMERLKQSMKAWEQKLMKS